MARTSHHRRWLFILGATLALLMAGIPRPVCADGTIITVIVADVKMPTQKAIIVYDAERGHEDLILSVELLGGSETGREGAGSVSGTATPEEEAVSAAWVVPLPSLPEVRAAKAGWFDTLDDLTKPKLEVRVKYVSYAEKGIEKVVVGEEGVELLSREQVGVYDVSILSADEPGALLEWLDEHGYAFPEEGGPLLDAYVQEGGWYFVAARVLPGESAYFLGDVKPLWFSFDAEGPIYPMRLTSLIENDIDVLLYVLADHRMKIGSDAFGFTTEFAGELTLEIPWFREDSDLVNLLTNRSYYVTKLRAESLFPPGLAEDLYLERAASDEPYRKVEIHTEYWYRAQSERRTTEPESEGPPSGLESEPLLSTAGEGPADRSGVWLLENPRMPAFFAGLALLGLLAGLGLVWRRSRR